MTKAHRYDPDLNPIYYNFALHCGFGIVRARPRCVALESGLLRPTALSGAQSTVFAEFKDQTPTGIFGRRRLLSFLLSATVRLAGEKLCSLMALLGRVVHRHRFLRLQPTPAHPDSARAYDRKRAQPRRNGRGAKGIARSHSCIVGTAGCRSNPTAVRRGTLRREIIRRFEALPRSDEWRLGVGGRRRNYLAKCEWASRQPRSVWQRSTSNWYAPSLSPESLRSLDSPIGSENGSSESAPAAPAPSQIPVADRGR